jgi:hypothetical protein
MKYPMKNWNSLQSLFGGKFQFVNPALPSVKKNSQWLYEFPQWPLFREVGVVTKWRLWFDSCWSTPWLYRKGCVTLGRQQIETLTLCSPMKQCMWERATHTHTHTHTHELWDHKLCERRTGNWDFFWILWFASNWSEEKFQGVGILHDFLYSHP